MIVLDWGHINNSNELGEDGYVHNNFANMIKRRHSEYQCGRRSANGALEKLGLDKTVLASHPNGRPIWPKGVIGSISHSKNICIAVASDDQSILGIGVDIQDTSRIEANEFVMISSDLERGKLATEFSDVDLARLCAFSAKESIFKALPENIQQTVSIKECEISHIKRNNLFIAQIKGHKELPPIFGIICEMQGLILTLCIIPSNNQRVASFIL